MKEQKYRRVKRENKKIIKRDDDLIVSITDDTAERNNLDEDRTGWYFIKEKAEAIMDFVEEKIENIKPKPKNKK